MRQIITFNNKNVVLPEPWVPPVPANDEIWYTSSDGNIVKPFEESTLPTIVSNTYKDGKGVIKFATELTSVGEQSFFNCARLTSVTIPNSVVSIVFWAFQYCTNLASINIPNSVANIGVGVFSGCTSLTSIEIPNSVTDIEDGAFEDCANLASILYTGTTAQYNAITKGTNWHYNVPATVVHCIDGDTPI